MGKLIKGELKKIFLKPGIFVVTAILVLILAISAIIFNVKPREDSVVNIAGSTDSTTTITQMYDKSFGSTQDTETLSKVYLYDKYVNSSLEIIEFYKNELQNTANSKKQELYALKDKIVQDRITLNSKISGSSQDTVTPEKDAARDELKQDIALFNTKFSSFINGNNGFYYLLISNKDKNEFDVLMSMALTQPFGSNITYSATINKLDELDVFNKFEKFIDNLLVFLPSEKDLTKAEENLNLAITNLEEIENQIETFKAEFTSERSLAKKEEFVALITRYQQASINIYNLTQFTVSDSALNDFSDDKIQSLYEFQNSEYKTKYVIKEQKNICQFYLNNNKYAFEYASPLSLNISSNAESNVYDFMYFALELCSFIIIIYVVFLGATMIAGEYANGTMKLLAIRPYSRNKILFSKLISTIIVGLIFLILTFIVTFITGGILFGLESLPMLLIFNSTLVASVSPIVSVIFLFLTKTIEIIFYAILALSISTLFKSNSGSIVIAILIYFASFILTMFTPSLGIFKFLPFVNTNLFGYFGSHSLTKSGSLIGNMFSRIIPNDMNFYVSFAIITLFSVLIYVITSIVFKKRDINK